MSESSTPNISIPESLTAKSLTCFTAYDIRGQLGSELNEEVAYAIGRAFALELKPKTIVVGGDIRLTSEPLKLALARGLQDEGVNVIDLGMTGTEEIYFATSYLGVCGGVEVTASHNPMDYNGMKLVREDSKPVSGDSGLDDIKAVAERVLNDVKIEGAASLHNARLKPRQPGEVVAASMVGGLESCGLESGELESRKNNARLKPRQPVECQPGTYEIRDLKTEYAKCMLSFVDVTKLKPLKLVVNSGNGAAGPALDAIEKRLIANGVNIEFIKVHHNPDGDFPNGIPNPLLPECRADTANAVKQHKADMGIAWDGDFDRCFLFDQNGDFIEGYYIVGLLAEAFLNQEKVGRTKLESGKLESGELGRTKFESDFSRPVFDTGSKEKIIHDPRLSWNTVDIVNAAGGIPVMSKTGHAFIKERMRSENAIYGGEMSAHHYFRDFSYCDSGMIPWLLVAELLSVKGVTLSSMVSDRISAYPSSGEINSKLVDPVASIAAVRAAFEANAVVVDETDGISLEFASDEGQWRFNLRSSNTEPVVRLNVESRGNAVLMKKKTEEILTILRTS